MMTERQGEILNGVVEEYVRKARPVSSQLVLKNQKLSVCPATVRNEMQELTDQGYLSQPHTSAGRVPTDKGYRHFVDGFLQKGFREREEMPASSEKQAEDLLMFTRRVTKILAEESSNLALGYLYSENIMWKEGWSDVLRKPEFKESECVSRFVRMLEDLEDKASDFSPSPEIQIYIGRENPFSKAADFGIIASSCLFPGNCRGFLTIVGPKRMSYDRNINLIDAIIKWIQKN